MKMEPRPPGTEPPLPRGPGPGPEPELELEPGPEPELDLELELDLEPEPDLDLQRESEPELEPEPEPELDLDPELELEQEADLDPEQELEPDPELEQEADLGPELDLDLWALEPAAAGAGPPSWCPGEAGGSPGPEGAAESPPEEEPRLRPVFDALDRDGDGFVRVEEFVQFATAYGAEQVSTGRRTCPPRWARAGTPGAAAPLGAQWPRRTRVMVMVASVRAAALGERQCPQGQRWHRPG